MERAEWLGYVTGQEQPLGYATAGEHYDEVMADVRGFIDHRQQPDGTWLPCLDPRDGRPWQALAPDPNEPVTTLHRSLTIASFLADQNFPPGSVVLHTIDMNPDLLTETYRQQHPGQTPVISRMWTDIRGARMDPA
ncbi:hypothetical protein [Streptomyces sp. NPDC097610]|uniref:hypothetical protein n=1 Tax=Streptomyces sp. NPDC097610 TaxID=3157227 RepID=UPI00332D46F1